MTKKKLYSFLLIVIFLGYGYFFYSLLYAKPSDFSFCIFKNVTGYPCPSCGTTRAVKLLAQKQWILSVTTNPFGVIVAFFMLIIPVWILIDLLTQKDSFYRSYKNSEELLKKKPLVIVLVVLVILNWIWNIKKGL